MAPQMRTNQRTRRAAGLKALLPLLLIAPVLANATGYWPLQILLAPEQRIRPEGRQIYVITDKELLASRIQPLGLASVMGGGLLGPAIDQAVETSREQKSQGPLEDIKRSLSNYDLGQKAVEAAAPLSSTLSWLNVKGIRSVVGKELQQEDISTMTGVEALIIQYKFQVEPRFDSIRLTAHADLVTKDLMANLISGTAKKTKSTDGLKFSQDFIVFVPLQNSTSDLHGNAALWADNGGEIARHSMDLALAGVTKLAIRALTVSEADRKVVSAKKAGRVGYSDRTADNYFGKILAEDDSGTLLETQLGQWVYYYWPKYK
jgi:hypothetical protein